MARRRSRAEVAIEAQLSNLDPSSERYHVLLAARDFKAAWVVFGEILTVIREAERYLEWGYTSFEAYCRRELHIRQDTANKLTRSFAFLRDHEPGAYEARAERELPPLDVVDLLTRAQERTKVSDAELDTIREEVFSPEGGVPTRSQVVRRFREVDPDAFRGSPRPRVAAGDGDLRKALLLAERLQGMLEVQEGISNKALDGVRRAAAELRELFEKSQAKKSA